MPNYDYTCEECHHEFETFQKITEAPLKKCPQCSKETLRRGFGGGGTLFRFKGNGFYTTDYCKKDSGGCGCSTTSHSCSSKE